MDKQDEEIMELQEMQEDARQDNATTNQIVAEQQAMRDIAPETQLEMQKYIIDPEASRIFPDVNKDYVLSNLDKRELFLLRTESDLAGHLLRLGLNDAASIFIRDGLVLLNSARSKGGFERRMLTTQTVKQRRTVERKRRKKWGIF